MMSSEGDGDAAKRLKFKVVLLGNAAVGKTSIAQHLVLHQFHEE
jgi:GTPase SAR1 family protein